MVHRYVRLGRWTKAIKNIEKTKKNLDFVGDFTLQVVIQTRPRPPRDERRP